MKIRISTSSTLFLLALLSACSGADDVPPSETPAAQPAEAPTPLEIAAVSGVAAPVAGALIQTLGGNLAAAIAADGPVGAMEFCNVEALPLTAQVADEQGLEVKRTSWRIRNPENAADALEAEALVHFATEAEAGVAPEPWVQRAADGGWRYYQPLPTGEMCLSCHGSAEQLADGVPEALERLYPDDAATGFVLGELRGLLRVSVPSTALAGG